MRRTALATAMLACLALSVRADTPANLKIVGQNVATNSRTSCWITLGIENTGTVLPLSAWQLVLQIVPVNLPMGTVSITGIATPSYVFGDGPTANFYWDPSYSFGDLFTDLADNPPVPVPANGRNLLQIHLTSSDAIGRFNILAVHDDGSGMCSNWVSSDLVPRNFDIASIDGAQKDIVASVQFGVVPEPSGGCLLGSGLIGIAVIAVLCHQRHKARLSALYQHLPRSQ